MRELLSAAAGVVRLFVRIYNLHLHRNTTTTVSHRKHRYRDLLSALKKHARLLSARNHKDPSASCLAHPLVFLTCIFYCSVQQLQKLFIPTDTPSPSPPSAHPVPHSAHHLLSVHSHHHRHRRPRTSSLPRLFLSSSDILTATAATNLPPPLPPAPVNIVYFIINPSHTRIPTSHHITSHTSQ